MHLQYSQNSQFDSYLENKYLKEFQLEFFND